VRGEEPVFVVTGRKEDVTKAKREILSAAEHFSQIRASRKSSTLASLAASGGAGGGATLGGSGVGGAAPSSMPGHVTIQVRVPYRVVGLVVGPKGATIKRIQHQTHTYIVTPSRDKEPVFEVTGLPESVEAARREIEAHIAMRTGAGGGLLDGSDGGGDNGDDLFSSIIKNGLNALATRFTDAPAPQSTPFFHANNGVDSAAPFSSCSSSSSTSSTSRLAELTSSIWSGSHDEGLGESPSLDSGASIWSDVKLAGNAAFARFSPPAAPVEHLPARRVSSDPLSASPTDSMGSLSSSGGRRECIVCSDKEIAAALVPCGHNLFCFDCAERVSEQPAQCPACQQPVLQAIRIFS
jgi:RNA-binding protein MEX3